MKGLFITGTDTNVGKTYIACLIAAELKSRNLNIIPRKPVETGCEIINDELYPADASVLLKASQSNITLDEVCPYRYTPPISPQLAIKRSGNSISLDDLVSTCKKNITEKDLLLVEGAGGFYSPICTDALNADLASRLNLPVILVTEDRVGAVNQALLAINAIEKHQLKICAVVLNSTGPETQNNLSDNTSEIKALTSHPVFSISHEQPISANFLKHLLLYL
ncbi:MAG: dethiobiotin synthase [endosymbiont of Galathealinum brachiosum]|uniref:ATP-dependent dethiobiotin synthetase BioD n=1 Tax=endosymbiont of Galathealinum brachiosum TaxID=2200906 RepID=A0A370DCZ2_9GAMM|nr:MAG: dethiobiotin synthase [endosymbiont of Galathealinum brachiosum]